MSIYFDHKIDNDVQGQIIEMQWHNTAPLLAAAFYTESGAGVVNVFLEEGQRVPEVSLKRSKAASVIAWHPTKKVLAVGWGSGEISVWNQTDKELTEAFPLHKSEITVMHWSGNGTRLVSCDTDGLLLGWKADPKGNLQQNPVFKHHIEEQIMHMILKTGNNNEQLAEMKSLARAAISGDSKALDMFAFGKSQSKKPLTLGIQEAMAFFLGGNKGGVYYIDEEGSLNQPYTADGPVRKLLFYEEKNILMTVTTAMMLTQHNVSGSGEMRELLKVKLSGKPDHADMVWAGKGILATCTGETVLRMWDIDHEENFVLALDVAQGFDRLENIICIAYCPAKNMLAGGTNMGNVALWKYHYTSTGEMEQCWKLQPPAAVSAGVSDLAWGSSRNLLAVNTVETIYILHEHTMSAYYSHQVGIVQTGPMSISIDCFETETHNELKTDIQVKGICITKGAFAVWDYKKVVVYELPNNDATNVKPAGTFATESTEIRLFEQNVYTLEPGKIQVRTFQGTVKQLLSLSEAEGNPVWLDVCGNFLVSSTTTGWLKLYDLSRRDAKLTGSKNLSEVVQGFSPETSLVDQVSCNCKGTHVCVSINLASGHPDPKLYVWDTELDNFHFFSLATGHGEQDEFLPTQQQDATAEELSKNQVAQDIAGRYPISHTWDPTEPKLLVCEAKLSKPGKTDPSKNTQNTNSNTTAQRATVEQAEVLVVALFVTPENGILSQDSFALAPHHGSLLAAEAPFYYFTKRTDVKEEEIAQKISQFNNRPKTSAPAAMSASRVSRRVMRDFMGLEEADKSSRDAMMDFSYYMTIGNMDEAFKAIKLIKSETVWENMAKMCVKNRRLDVALVCLGNMSHARGAKALREAAQEPELDAKVAILAIHLGMLEEAERLLVKSQRYDLLNQLYQNTNRWNKALETAELYDRIHLRTTYFNYARHLEACHEYSEAIPNYEKSGNHRFEVPRMLFDDQTALENYIMKHKDKELRLWWAQYMESTGDMETALKYYEAAGDVLSLVRVHCYCGNMDKAAQICNETGDKAASYHLARQYENTGQKEAAVKYFTRAGAYGSALRLSKEGAHEDQLLQLALLGKKQDMLDAAKHYEQQPGSEDKAVMLYHKAGLFSKALDLAFETKQFGALQHISEDLDENTDPATLQKCADFFVENHQFDRAVDVLAVAKRYREALAICAEQHVPMTEELVERLSPSNDHQPPEERNNILEQVAEVCLQQRQYHLATKKFTQAGNRVKAMKVLLKSGDTEKIVFFAQVSRQREIYVMAGNYLQTLDWRKDPEIMKNIIGFYTKGRALDLLAGFYDACAQVEIDEYQNYEKALGALNEAYKCMSKAQTSNQTEQEDRLNDLQNRMGHIKKFVSARKSYNESPEESNRQLQLLLEEPHIDVAVRIGDIYGFMAEQLARREKFRAAYNCLEDLRARIPKVNVAYYVDMQILKAIYSALNLPMKDVQGPKEGGGEEDGEEFVEEDVED